MGDAAGITMLVTLLAISLLFAIDRPALWMERGGYVYWRKHERTGGGRVSGLLTDFQQLVEPEVRQVIEAKEQDRAIKIDYAGRGDDKKLLRDVRRS